MQFLADGMGHFAWPKSRELGTASPEGKAICGHTEIDLSATLAVKAGMIKKIHQ